MVSDKYIELEKQYKKLQKDLKLRERQIEFANKEKEALQREINKSILLQEKLKDVCREQQKLIKSVGNESVQQIREEEVRRKENQDKFQKSLNEINDMLAKNNDENAKLRNDNIEMSHKLLSLTKQCEVREEQIKQFEEKINIDTQLSQAKLKKMQIEFTIQKDILIQEKKDVTNRLLNTQTLLEDFRQRESTLQEQLNLYSSKYDTFQNAIQKSNTMFSKYKSEIQTMSKNTRRLEKELLEWKRKYEKCNATLIEISTERNEKEINASRCAKQMEQLQKLLRTLHNERKALYKALAENEIESPNLQSEFSEHVSSPRLMDKCLLTDCSELNETVDSVKDIEVQQDMERLKISCEISATHPEHIDNIDCIDK